LNVTGKGTCYEKKKGKKKGEIGSERMGKRKPRGAG